jgi:hypothetical protein
MWMVVFSPGAASGRAAETIFWLGQAGLEDEEKTTQRASRRKETLRRAVVYASYPQSMAA